jgi:hypothetical protein
MEVAIHDDLSEFEFLFDDYLFKVVVKQTHIRVEVMPGLVRGHGITNYFKTVLDIEDGCGMTGYFSPSYRYKEVICMYLEDNLGDFEE